MIAAWPRDWTWDCLCHQTISYNIILLSTPDVKPAAYLMDSICHSIRALMFSHAAASPTGV